MKVLLVMEVIFGVCAVSTLVFASLAASAQAQQTPPVALPPVQRAPQTPAPQKPVLPAAQQFPFPGEPDGKDAATPDAPGAATGQRTTGQGGVVGEKSAPVSDPAAAEKGKSASQKFPFPGETDGASDVPGSAPANDGFSSSRPNGGSAADGEPPLNDAGSSGDAPEPKHGKRRALPKVERVQTDEQRESEDLDVAAYYMNDQNYRGAYLRAVDAVGLKPEDAFAQMALAEAAQKLGKAEEARTHFEKALTLDVDPKQKAAAEKGLRELGKK